MNNEKVDFVVLWVDGNDINWQNEKRKYENSVLDNNVDNNNIRYRDWDNLKYWFRGIEEFAPWVNKIHFITCGHIPNWLNTNNPKLNIVKHSDYMPHDCLPTFNSNSIELLIHKIDGLSEKFVLFNDDTFLINNVKVSDFFKNGLPKNTMSLSPIIPNIKRPYYKTVANNLELINKYFNFKECKKNNFKKYISIKQGKYILKTYPLLSYKDFVGFANFHLANSYLKSTFEEVWNKNEQILLDTVYSRFRNYETNVNHWLFNYWQFAKGNFIQRSYKFGKNLQINDTRVPNIIINQKYKMLGLGDNANINNFEEVKNTVNQAFDKILKDKCSFEK